MTDFNWAQAIFNGSVALGGFSGFCYMFKRWMDAREKAESQNRIDASIQADKIAKEFQEKHEKSCNEIMAKISENKIFYKTANEELKQEIRTVADLQRVANGRTGKIEVRLAVLEQAHKDRNETCGV